MPEITAHPSRQQLSAYNLGQLSAEEATTIESHVSECEPCCDTIINLASDDTFVGLLREAKELPTDQTAGQGVATAASPCQDIPVQLGEHPRYEVLSLIGKGGMGDVYKARHRKMERTVALKVINRGLVRKAEAIDRFHREVKAAAQLSHPNIVTAHDADQAGDFHFMVMEYVDGVNLSQTVNKRGALPVAEACDYIRQAATGLQHAHQRGMVHRDIKPHNLMVTADGTLKILDFGLASLAPEAIPASDAVATRSDLTAAGAIMGTPDFISPEQASDARQADIRSDIYSLGATLYFLLAGQPPFAGGSLTQKLESHAQEEPEPLESLRADVPLELAAVVTKMTAKDPGARFQTPAEVAEALKSLPHSVEPLKRVEPPAQTQPRRWKAAFLSLTAVAAMFVAAFFAGLIYYVQTDHGVVRVEVTDPSLEVSIKDHTITMEDGDGKPLTIRPGEQTLIVRKDDADFETDSFQIRRGDKFAFKVEFVKGEVVVRKDGERFDTKTLPNDVNMSQFPDRMAETRKAVTRQAYVLGMGKVVAFVPHQSDRPATIDPETSERAVELWVSGDDAKVVQEGDRVRLEFEGWPVEEPGGVFGGKVINLDPTADGAGMFRVLIKEDKSESWPDKRYLRPGVRANCWIFTAARNRAQQGEAQSSMPTVEE
ncbi:MAG: protein kinase, partial [Planctomycetota bacterium]